MTAPLSQRITWGEPPPAPEPKPRVYWDAFVRLLQDNPGVWASLELGHQNAAVQASRLNKITRIEATARENILYARWLGGG